MNEKQVLQFLGLAHRAGKLLSGEEIVLNSIRAKKCKLIILATDASENTKKKLQDKCSYYHVPLLQFVDRYQLGQAIGKPHRVVIGITDQGFADKVVNESILGGE